MNYFRQLFVLILIPLCFITVKADWKKLKVNSFAWFHSVYFVNQNKGWIVGSQGAYLYTTDGGATWRQKEKFTNDTIRDVYFTDEQNGWILCERDIYNVGTLSPSYILKTSNGGESWDKVNLDGDGKERLVKIFFSKDGFGYAVGEAGTFFAMQEDKKTWKKVNLSIRYLLLDGRFFNQKNGLIIGGGGSAYFTEDGGNTWNPANFVTKSNTKLNAVYFINQNTGWTVGAEGKIFMSLNGGKLWHEQKSPIKTDLLDVFFVNTSEGWAVGDEGVLLYTTTAGNVWTPMQSVAKHKLERIFFNGQTGWIVGFGGTILSYNKNYKETNPPKITPALQKRTYSAAY